MILVREQGFGCPERRVPLLALGPMVHRPPQRRRVWLPLHSPRLVDWPVHVAQRAVDLDYDPGPLVGLVTAVRALPAATTHAATLRADDRVLLTLLSHRLRTLADDAVVRLAQFPETIFIEGTVAPKAISNDRDFPVPSCYDGSVQGLNTPYILAFALWRWLNVATSDGRHLAVAYPEYVYHGSTCPHLATRGHILFLGRQVTSVSTSDSESLDSPGNFTVCHRKIHGFLDVLRKLSPIAEIHRIQQYAKLSPAEFLENFC